MGFLRFWEVKNVKKGRKLMGLDMFLLDEKDAAYRDLFNDGSVYKSSGFYVTSAVLIAQVHNWSFVWIFIGVYTISFFL